MAKSSSNHQARKLVEKLPFYPKDDQEYKPGDQVRISIPSDPGETDSVWGYILRTKAPDGKVTIVVDEVVVINKDIKYQPKRCAFIDKGQIIGHIPADASEPTISMTLIEGSLIELNRIDGRTVPIVVQINIDSSSEFWNVTHTGGEKIK